MAREDKVKLNHPCQIIVYICLLMFLVNNKTSFDYYKQDQTINPRTYCAIFFQKIQECSSYA